MSKELSIYENRLINAYRQLNGKGKKFLLEIAETCPNYEKFNSEQEKKTQAAQQKIFKVIK